MPVRVQICLKSGKDCRQATCQSCSMLFIAAISGYPVCLSPLSPPPRPAVLRPPPHPSPRNEENSRRNECHQRNLYFCTSHLLNGRLPTFPPPLPRERKYARIVYFSICVEILTPTAFLSWREGGGETR